MFHGCSQARSFRLEDGTEFGRRFVDDTGYTAWAEAAGIVVLFPQVKPSGSLSWWAALGDPRGVNPKGCWDFWGYSTGRAHSEPDAYGTRDAPQMRAVKAMIDDLRRVSR